MHKDRRVHFMLYYIAQFSRVSDLGIRIFIYNNRIIFRTSYDSPGQMSDLSEILPVTLRSLKSVDPISTFSSCYFLSVFSHIFVLRLDENFGITSVVQLCIRRQSIGSILYLFIVASVVACCWLLLLLYYRFRLMSPRPSSNIYTVVCI